MRSSLPLRGKLDSQFSVAERTLATPVSEGKSTLSSAPKPSGHSTAQMVKIKKAYPWIYKTFEAKQAGLPELEAAMASLYQLMVNHSTPKVRAVYRRHEDSFTVLDTTGNESFHPSSSYKCIAVTAKLLPVFMDFETFGVDASKFGYLISNGLGEILALSYFFEEDDLHKRNLVLSLGKLMRIDFDMSAFSLVGDPSLRGPRSYPAGSALLPAESFRLHSDDIDNFPDLQHQKPYYWPTVYHAVFAAGYGYSPKETEEFKSLKEHEDFIHRVYRTFLKIVLMPDSAIRAHLEAHIGDPELLEKFQLHFIQRKTELAKVLLQSKRFQLWWKSTLQDSDLNHIETEVDAYNVALKPRYQCLRVNKEEILPNYLHFCQSMSKVFMYASLGHLREMVNKLRIIDHRYALMAVMRQALERESDRFCQLSSPSTAQFLEYECHIKRIFEGVMSLFAFESALGREAKHELGIQCDDIHDDLRRFYQEMKNALKEVNRFRSWPSLSAGALDGAAAPGSTRMALSGEGMGGNASALLAPMTQDQLLELTLNWMAKPEARVAILTLFRTSLSEYKDRFTGVSSFFSKKAWHLRPANVFQDSLEKLESREVSNVEFPTLFRSEFTRLSIIDEWDPESFHVRLALNLISHYSRVFFSKHLVEQLKNGAPMVDAQRESATQIIRDMETAKLFIEKLQPQEKIEQVEGGEWCVVSGAFSKK